MSTIKEFDGISSSNDHLNNKQDFVIFCAPAIEPLADAICQSLQRKYPNSSVCKGRIDYNKFADGFPNIYIHGAACLSQKDVIYVCSLDTPGDIFIQLSTMYMFNSYCIRTLNIVCPYIPTGTMERAQIMGEVPTAVTLAKMFGILPLHCRLLIVDLHTQHNLYYFPANISPMFIHAVPTLLRHLEKKDNTLFMPTTASLPSSQLTDAKQIKSTMAYSGHITDDKKSKNEVGNGIGIDEITAHSPNPTTESNRHQHIDHKHGHLDNAKVNHIINKGNMDSRGGPMTSLNPYALTIIDSPIDLSSMVVVFPDEGACKRYGVLFQQYPRVLCSKIRRGDERIVTIIEGDCRDKDVIIIDDLVHSGGTLIECVHVCITAQCKSVNIFTTHGVFENASYKRFIALYNANKLQRFYLANTHPMALQLVGVKPFIILDVSDAITENI